MRNSRVLQLRLRVVEERPFILVFSVYKNKKTGNLVQHKFTFIFFKKSLGVRKILARSHFSLFVDDTRENRHFHTYVQHFLTPSPLFNVEMVKEFFGHRTKNQN